MTFVSLTFLIFLPIVFAFYWMFNGSLRWQNLFLVIASYVFYGWWDYRFLILILITSISSYACGIILEKSRQPRKRKIAVAANVALNLSILGCFKYLNFFIDSLSSVLNVLGWHVNMPLLQVVLPVGISFYTFQSLSYVFDVYRQKIGATTDAVAFLAYISFFPQLVAGPIERASNLLPQMTERRHFNYAQATDGLRQILWGFFKKMVIADNCALAVNQIWDQWQDASGAQLLLGAVLFTFQIYGDFSGYSDIAIGTARLFGISLSDNFRYPYFSRSVTEFWRRWHISLMSWFRDYVYIPLGGSRGGRRKTLRNVFIVFFLSGLWHGANWTFVAWGLYNACLLAIPILLGIRRKKDEHTPVLRELPQILCTFVLVTIGWTMFRSNSITDGIGYLGRLFTLVPSIHLSDLTMGKAASMWCFCLVVIEWMTRDRRYALEQPSSGILRHTTVRWLLYYVLFFIIFLFHGQSQTFIYFQF